MSKQNKDPESPSISGLSRLEMNRGMRAFLTFGVMGAAWGQIVSINTAIFTGFALWLGVSDVTIGLLASFATGASLVQLFSLQLIGRFRNRKHAIVYSGLIEVFVRWSVLLIPFLFYRHIWVAAFLALIVIGNMFAHATSPVLNSWYGATVPDKIRGAYFARRTILVTLSGMVAAFLGGRFIDKVSDYKGFFIVFTVAALFGIAAYLITGRAPYPRKLEPRSVAFFGIMKAAFATQGFKPYILFYMAWSFAASIAGAYYSVFMIRHLKLSYTTIALLTNAQMVVMMIGYQLWGKLIDRYGSKPLLQTLFIPGILAALLWMFNKEGFYPFLVVAMLLGGITGSGLALAANSLLYSLVAEAENKPALLAAFSVLANTAAFLGPIIGSILSSVLADFRFSFLGIPFGSIQVIFLAGAITMLIPLFLIRRVQDTRAVQPGKFLADILRGNIFNYMYGSFLFSRAMDADQKLHAAYRLGRSQSPLAIQKLARAMEDPDLALCKAATIALGETGQTEAIPFLLKQLDDRKSVVRQEAAAALGKLRSKSSIDHLLRALDDEEFQIRASAVTSLADIGGKRARESLFSKFNESFDQALFPLLVQALGRLRELAIVPDVIYKIDSFQSLVIQRQLLHSVSRLFDDRGDFYRALLMDEWQSTGKIESILNSIRKKLSNFNQRYHQKHNDLINSMDNAIQAFYSHELNISPGVIIDLAERLKVVIKEKIADNLTAKKAIEAVLAFYSTETSKALISDGLIFSAICLRSAVETLLTPVKEQ